MEQYLTTFPVLTHTGEEILPAHWLIDEPTILALTKKPADRSVVNLGKERSFIQDLKDLFESTTYSAIFHESETRNTILESLKQVLIPACEYEAIQYFRSEDLYTYKHMLAVFCLSSFICTLLKSTVSPLETFIGSLSHDIGKCSIPKEILNKKTPLTKDERKYIEHHSLAGFVLLTYYLGNKNTISAVIARDHHENKKGTGYPTGKQNIDLQTEIVIACDIYDALLSPRPYRSGPFENRTALEELTKKTIGGQISEEIIKALIAGNRQNKMKWKECQISTEYRGLYPKDNSYGRVIDEIEFGL